MTDLDAIRARAKAARVIEGFPEHDHSPAALDREALLAEVDRLTAALDVCIALKEREVDDYRARAAVAEARANILADAMVDRNIDRWDRGVEHERARALPVIEAARALMDNSTVYEPLYEEWDALRTALAEYDR